MGNTNRTGRQHSFALPPGFVGGGIPSHMQCEYCGHIWYADQSKPKSRCPGRSKKPRPLRTS